MRETNGNRWRVSVLYKCDKPLKHAHAQPVEWMSELTSCLGLPGSPAPGLPVAWGVNGRAVPAAAPSGQRGHPECGSSRERLEALVEKKALPALAPGRGAAPS